jgi:hypothetical protein
MFQNKRGTQSTLGTAPVKPRCYDNSLEVMLANHCAAAFAQIALDQNS